MYMIHLQLILPLSTQSPCGLTNVPNCSFNIKHHPQTLMLVMLLFPLYSSKTHSLRPQKGHGELLPATFLHLVLQLSQHVIKRTTNGMTQNSLLPHQALVASTLNSIHFLIQLISISVRWMISSASLGVIPQHQWVTRLLILHVFFPYYVLQDHPMLNWMPQCNYFLAEILRHESCGELNEAVCYCCN